MCRWCCFFLLRWFLSPRQRRVKILKVFHLNRVAKPALRWLHSFLLPVLFFPSRLRARHCTPLLRSIASPLFLARPCWCRRGVSPNCLLFVFVIGVVPAFRPTPFRLLPIRVDVGVLGVARPRFVGAVSLSI